MISDKQQELDLPTLRVEDTEGHGKKNKKTPMSQIVGVRKLKHTNSFTGVVPKYGVEATNEEDLSKVRGVLRLSTYEYKHKKCHQRRHSNSRSRRVPYKR